MRFYTAVFVGGPLDGSEEERTWPPPDHLVWPGEAMTPQGETTVHRYRRSVNTGGRRPVVVYEHEGWVVA